jgi:hypothetical protein
MIKRVFSLDIVPKFRFSNFIVNFVGNLTGSRMGYFDKVCDKVCDKVQHTAVFGTGLRQRKESTLPEAIDTSALTDLTDRRALLPLDESVNRC